MIAFQPLLFIIGILLNCLAVSMIAPALLDWFYEDINWRAFLISASVTGFSGLLLTLANRSSEKITLSIRDTFLLTSCTWLVVTFFAALPFLFSYSTSSLTDSFFEAISGLTTTGATVLLGIDFTSPGIILWRAILQWLGGIGIVVMAMTIMPILRIGGMQLFRNESSDRSEKILPRVSQIASAILFVYVFFTFLCGLLLWIAGMKPLEAVCHAFATVSTGGFSTSDASLGYFHSVSIEIITMIFMVIGSISFVLFVRAFQGDVKAVFKDAQVLTFIGFLGFSIGVLCLWQYYRGVPLLQALRESSFSVTSILTTTGYTTVDFNLWGSFALVMFLMLMQVGGCTGSTSGGVKVFRYKILFAVAKVQIAQLRRPHGIFVPKYNKRPISVEVFNSVFTFFALYVACFGGLALGLAFYDLDILTCLSGSISALNNIGPGLGSIIGPSGSFASLPDGAKWMLMIGMLLGRLEYATVLILLTPNFWRS